MIEYDETVQEYMHRLEALGSQESYINRFFIAIADEELLDLEEELIQAGNGLSLHVPVLSLYHRWKEEMGEENWAEVVAFNEGLSDADRNWLVSEEMTESVAEV